MRSNSGFFAVHVAFRRGCGFLGSISFPARRSTASEFRPILYYCLNSETNNETYLPTLRCPSQTHSRFPRSYGDPQRPRRAQCASCQGPQAPGSISPAHCACGGVTDTRLQGYARDRRIVKTDEFSSVFRLRPTQRTEHFVLYVRPNGLPHARLGVVVPKRHAARAVTRNTIKRVTREVFRQGRFSPADCVVRMTRPVNRKDDVAASVVLKEALREELMRLFKPQRLPEQHS